MWRSLSPAALGMCVSVYFVGPPMHCSESSSRALPAPLDDCVCVRGHVCAICVCAKESIQSCSICEVQQSYFPSTATRRPGWSGGEGIYMHDEACCPLRAATRLLHKCADRRPIYMNLHCACVCVCAGANDAPQVPTGTPGHHVMGPARATAPPTGAAAGGAQDHSQPTAATQAIRYAQGKPPPPPAETSHATEVIV